MDQPGREEEHDRGDQRGERRDDEVEGSAEFEPAERCAGDEEEHPGEVRVRGPPSRVREGDLARGEESPGDAVVLADVASEIHEAGERGEAERQAEDDDREEGGRGGLPHPAGDGPAVEKVVVLDRNGPHARDSATPARSPIPFTRFSREFA